MKILNVVTEHIGPFKLLMEVLKEILQETNIEFRHEPSPDGGEDIRYMKIFAVDTTKTVLINLRLEGKHFTEFECKYNGGKLILGVNLTYFYKLIKTIEKEEKLSLYVENESINSLKIKIENEAATRETIYNLKLLDLGIHKLDVPPIQYIAQINMTSSLFHKICREMSGIADYVEIVCYPNKVVFTCKGEYADRSTTVRYDPENLGDDSITIQMNPEDDGPLVVQGIYELRNLALFTKCTQLCEDLEIYMKNNYPMTIKYTVANLGKILLCLTPTHPATKNSNFSDDDEFYNDHIESVK